MRKVDTKQVVRFGLFEVTLNDGLLTKSGTRIRLQEQPFKILAMLLECPGEVVSREVIRQKLWPANTFVEFDDGLNTAIRKLRFALSDSADSPRFIETIPRRGYRFVAPVMRDTLLTLDSPLKVDGKLWRIAFTVLLCACAIVVGVYYHSRRSKPLTERDNIILSDFTNTTGDAVFDDTLRQGLSVQLEQSPFLALISDRRVHETLKLMGRPAADRLTPEVTREVCLRTGSKAVLAGSIAVLGSHYVIGLKAMNCSTGDVLAEEQEQAEGKETVLRALDAAAVSMRSKLGESLSTVQKYAMPLREASTPSLEALNAYSMGQKMVATSGATAALPLFKRAVEIDPEFALAYAAMSASYSNLNEMGRATEYAQKAYGLRARVSEPERFPIEVNYYEATRQLEKAAQVCELWHQSYPREIHPVWTLGGIYSYLGQHEKALEQNREVLRMGGNDGSHYINLGFEYAALNRLDEADAAYKQAEQRIQNEVLLFNRYQLAFVREDTAQMAQLVDTAMGNLGEHDLMLAVQADTEAWYGRLKNARELTQRAMDSAEHNDAKETAATYQAAAALREVESGNRQRARAEVEAAMKLASTRDVQYIEALVLARVGDTAAAEKLAAELDKAFPQDTLVHGYWLPCIQAAVALQRNEPDRAIELLKPSVAIELSVPPTMQVVLVPAYLRGEAYLMLHAGNAAVAEFQKFIDHRGLVGNFPWGALARLRLARAYVVLGDTAKARVAYQNFLTLWKDADPDIFILKQARAEYAKVQ